MIHVYVDMGTWDSRRQKFEVSVVSCHLDFDELAESQFFLPMTIDVYQVLYHVVSSGFCARWSR